jgi:MFS family permease
MSSTVATAQGVSAPAHGEAPRCRTAHMLAPAPSVLRALTPIMAVVLVAYLFFGHLPDRIGGARVALVCVVIEALGLGMIWLAPSAALVFVGSAITGVGYSLVYPGFGVEAVRLAPPEAKGLAMGAFTAFLDLSLGVSSPALGLVASHTGLNSVFLVSTVVVLSAAAIAAHLLTGAVRPNAAERAGAGIRRR